MKLRTELLEIGGQMRLATFYGCGDSGSPREAISHDAMAAHALLQAIDTVRGYYPESVFPENGESLDCKSASMARHTCDNIKKRADELMREWTGEVG